MSLLLSPLFFPVIINHFPWGIFNGSHLEGYACFKCCNVLYYNLFRCFSRPIASLCVDLCSQLHWMNANFRPLLRFFCLYCPMQMFTLVLFCVFKGEIVEGSFVSLWWISVHFYFEIIYLCSSYFSFCISCNWNCDVTRVIRSLIRFPIT